MSGGGDVRAALSSRPHAALGPRSPSRPPLRVQQPWTLQLPWTCVRDELLARTGSRGGAAVVTTQPALHAQRNGPRWAQAPTRAPTSRARAEAGRASQPSNSFAAAPQCDGRGPIVRVRRCEGAKACHVQKRCSLNQRAHVYESRRGHAAAQATRWCVVPEADRSLRRACGDPASARCGGQSGSIMQVSHYISGKAARSTSIARLPPPSPTAIAVRQQEPSQASAARH